jgi:uncharacterized iron-regulated protein
VRRRDRARLRFWSRKPGPVPRDVLRTATLPAAAAAVALLLAACIAERVAPTAGAACAAAGSWLEPATRRTVAGESILRRSANARIVLLGEVHDEADHHHWQLQVLAALHERNRPLVIGVEMLPRGAQPALDRWIAGAFSDAEFLEAVRWKETWGHDPALYLPAFHFARSHRIPMVALNVERSLVSRVARDGWGAVPAGERHGIGDPAPPVEAYRRSLASIFAAHGGSGGNGSGGTSAGGSDGGPADVRLERFTQAQLTWDRAMAEAIATAAATRPEATIVGIVGRGHLEHGWGIPHQLRDLDGAKPMVLLPVGEDEACAPAAGLADAVFVLPPPKPSTDL